MAEKTLVASATKGGAAEKTGKQVADVLRSKFGLQVDTLNLSKQQAPNLGTYRNIVVGTGVRQGEVYEEAKSFLSKDFKGKQVAYFTCSSFIYPKTYEETVARYVTALLGHYPSFKPVAVEAFGGYLKILGLPVSSKMNPDKVAVWAETVGKKFTK